MTDSLLLSPVEWS